MFQKTPVDLEMPTTSSSSSSPPWEVLDLVALFLDPDSLATASCVSKSWSISLSSDHLWHPLCSAAYPSLSALRTTTTAATLPSYRKLYSLGRAADIRRLQRPPKPQLSLNDLLFSVDIRDRHDRMAAIVQRACDLVPDRNGIFRFDMDVGDAGDSSGRPAATVKFDKLAELKITWNVVVEGFKGVFGMMECEGKGNFVLGLDGWFSKELPAAPCCSGGGASGMVADLRLGMRQQGEEGGGGGAAVERVSVGVVSVVSWRYVSVEEVLRYLQHFLLPF